MKEKISKETRNKPHNKPRKFNRHLQNTLPSKPGHTCWDIFRDRPYISLKLRCRACKKKTWMSNKVSSLTTVG